LTAGLAGEDFTAALAAGLAAFLAVMGCSIGLDEKKRRTDVCRCLDVRDEPGLVPMTGPVIGPVRGLPRQVPREGQEAGPGCAV
jgi:hypothetical protein